MTKISLLVHLCDVAFDASVSISVYVQLTFLQSAGNPGGRQGREEGGGKKEERAAREKGTETQSL